MRALTLDRGFKLIGVFLLLPNVKCTFSRCKGKPHVQISSSVESVYGESNCAIILRAFWNLRPTIMIRCTHQHCQNIKRCPVTDIWDHTLHPKRWIFVCPISRDVNLLHWELIQLKLVRPIFFLSILQVHYTRRACFYRALSWPQ